MSYDVFITRKEFSADDEGAVITLEEWLDYARSRSDFELASPKEGLAIWRAPDGEELAWFDHWGGSIHAQNPDDPTFRAIIAIALALGAKVQGADGELRGPGGRI